MKYLSLCLLVISSIQLTACQSGDDSRAMGTIERDNIILSAPASEQITQVLVSEGQNIEQGEVLLQLDTTSANALLAQRQAELEQTQAALNLLMAGTRSEQLDAAAAALEAAKAASQEAELNYQRSQKLYQSKAIGKADLDTAKANRDNLKAKVQQVYNQWLELKNGSRSEEISQAIATVKGAQAALDWQHNALDDLTIISPITGTVDTLPWHQGDRVTSGTQLISLLANTTPYARVYLPASALTKVKTGDSILLYADGIETPLQGKIRNIRTQPAYTPFYALNERDRARLMYLTDIDLLDSNDLPSGLAVEVRLP